MPASSKVALVSGGSRGLGAELVTGFLNRRYGVATLSRTKTAFITRTLRARRPQQFLWSCVDGRDPEALQVFVKDAGERLGRIDVLVNNAGIGAEGVLPTRSRRQCLLAKTAASLTSAKGPGYLQGFFCDLQGIWVWRCVKNPDGAGSYCTQ